MGSDIAETMRRHKKEQEEALALRQEMQRLERKERGETDAGGAATDQQLRADGARTHTVQSHLLKQDIDVRTCPRTCLRQRTPTFACGECAHTRHAAAGIKAPACTCAWPPTRTVCLCQVGLAGLSHRDWLVSLTLSRAANEADPY